MTAIPAKPTAADFARWHRLREQAEARAARLRVEDCQPPVSRLARPIHDEGTAEVVDTILQVVAAPPGWRVAFACRVRPSEAYERVEFEDVLAFAVGLERAWPITCMMSAEYIATAEEWLWRWATVAPDGAFYFWNEPEREVFSSADKWLAHLNSLDAERAAA